MKYNLIIAIIFNLTIGLTLVPLIESYTIWVHNKLWAGTLGLVDATVDGKVIAGGSSFAHYGFNFTIPDDREAFNLTFSVRLSTEKDKTRGPFANVQDYIWKFTGSEDIWHIKELKS